MKQNLQRILHRARDRGDLDREEIVELLSVSEGTEIHALIAAAGSVRRACVGDEVRLRGIVEFSNACERSCLYCGLRCGNRKVERYRMSEDEIAASAREMARFRIPTIVLQSGEDSSCDAERICRMVRRIRKETGLIVTLSIGERTREEYREFRRAGADRYLLKHETADVALYGRLRPASRFENRLQCLAWLKELGYEVGSGNMVGLPGQSLESLADDILLMKDLDIDMIGIGPFISHPDTPLGGFPNGSIDLVLKTIAVARMATRNTNIPATTALGTLDPDGRTRALAAGANVIMPDFTPAPYRSHYEIYPGRNRTGADQGIFLENLSRRLASAGRTLGYDASGWRE
ncbi:MAG: Biotin synthase [Syntrophaceae bacterium PtaU1.Bin231]|nr:MAG: Biotin synthase [Syntrophaceae bacterium PtaU1.Bin231]